MIGLPATRPHRSAPGASVPQARADGLEVEVRTFGGALVRKVDRTVADQLIANKLGDRVGDGHIRLKLGIRWLPSRCDRVGGHPNLDEMQVREPERYDAIWRGNREAHSGKGAIGRESTDETVHLRPGRGLKQDGREQALGRQRREL
jgi:hypothetical protein